ncbi:MAG: 50S ribosomal protein L6 [Chloroflexi bacterium]|nr:50S ribosomal protein L6 [Chloroflexota bacterium]
MSRVGAKPIVLPQGVEVDLAPGNKLAVKGPAGSLSQAFHPDMRILLTNGVLQVERPSDVREHKALHGLTRALIQNMVLGVTQGFRKELEITGVGYRAQQSGDKIVFQVGYSHPVEYQPPPGVRVTLDSPTRLAITGVDKQKVGQVAAEIRRIRKPDRYKGKGIRYAGEVVTLKPGKAVARK